MSVVIYDDTYGARPSKVFGCSFKSITSQMGFNSQPIIFTVTVVEEDDQDFVLDKDDVRSVQYVEFGELSIFGIVQSWERTTTDIQGTGIYTVRLTDCRTVLDAASIANVYVSEPESEVSLIDSNVIYTGTDGTITDPDGSSKSEDYGTPFSLIMDRVEAATLKYGNNSFEVDMSELRPLTNMNGEGVEDYYIHGEIRSLISVITEFCTAVGAEWWVESRQKGIVDPTIIISIKVIRRLNKIGNPYAIQMDDLALMHAGKIIRRTDGYENNYDTVTNKVLWGGIKRTLKETHGVGIKQFWGFDNDGVPLSSPSYTLPGDPYGSRIPTTIEEMEDAINGYLDGTISNDQLSALKKYADDYWGKRFYTETTRRTLSDGIKELTNYPEVIPAGWWESDGSPRGTSLFDSETLSRLTTEDGRWGAFVKLPNIYLTGSGTQESPIQPNYIEWASSVAESIGLLNQEDERYMKCIAEQSGPYVVMTLPVPLTRYYTDPVTKEIDEERFTRHSSLDKSWVPMMDRSLRYGPWSNNAVPLNAVQSAGIAEVNVDADLVPWTFGTRGMAHSSAMAQLTELAAQKIDVLPSMSVINTGQLEVADVPKVNIGQAVGDGGSITEIFVRFEPNGISTRYVMNLYTKELGEFKRRKQREFEKQKEKIEQQQIESFPTTNEDIQNPSTEPVPDPASQGLTGPTKKAIDWGSKRPEGGLGVILGTEFVTGPFYTVRRVSYQDIDPQTFAGNAMAESYFLSEWHNVRNLAEDEYSPGLLLPGTRVTVSIFSEHDETGPWVPYIEQTPQVFAPPPVI